MKNFLKIILIIILPVFLISHNRNIKRSKFIQKPLIYLDPGHGGLDLGAVIKKPRCEEKKYKRKNR